MPQLVKVSTYRFGREVAQAWMTDEQYAGHVASLPAGWHATWE